MRHKHGAAWRLALVVGLSATLVVSVPAFAGASTGASTGAPSAAPPTLSVSKPKTAPQRQVTLSGAVPAGSARAVSLQLRSAGHWVTKKSGQTTATGHFSFVAVTPNLVGKVQTYRVYAPKTVNSIARATPSRTVTTVSPFRLVTPKAETETASQVAPDGNHVLYATGTDSRTWHLVDRSSGKQTKVTHSFADLGSEFNDSAAYFDWSTMAFRRVKFDAFAAERADNPALVTDTVITDASPDGRFAVGYATLYKGKAGARQRVRSASYLYDRLSNVVRALPTGTSSDSKAVAVSDTGRYVLFLDTDYTYDRNGQMTRATTQAVWLDRLSSSVPVVSFSTQAPGNMNAITSGRALNGLAMSGNGKTVLFSSSQKLTAAQGGLFIWHRSDQRTTQVDARAAAFVTPTLSFSGLVIGYVGLPPGTASRGRIAWRLDTATGEKHQVIRALDGKAPNGASGDATISMNANGRFFAFLADATNLVPQTRGARSRDRVYLYDDRV
jgi:hypothetical protein